MQHNSNALIVVAKHPAPGKTKTRLSPPLTPELASALYESFLFDTLDQMRQVADSHHVIAYLDERDYFIRVAPDFELIPQEGHDLGADANFRFGGARVIARRAFEIEQRRQNILGQQFPAAPWDRRSEGRAVNATVLRRISSRLSLWRRVAPFAATAAIA